MKKFRGFLLKNRVISIFRRLRRKHNKYRRININPSTRSCFLKWGARIKAKARSICFNGSGYMRVREDPVVVPKGKMAVYVGNDGGDYERVLVPVIYINHPLFGQLLRKTEEEYGHDHHGGLTIPCRISEFEKVKSRIAAGCGGRKMLPWKRHV